MQRLYNPDGNLAMYVSAYQESIVKILAQSAIQKSNC